jgi:hypothetical protein
MRKTKHQNFQFVGSPGGVLLEEKKKDFPRLPDLLLDIVDK